MINEQFMGCNIPDDPSHTCLHVAFHGICIQWRLYYLYTIVDKNSTSTIIWTRVTVDMLPK